MKPHPTPGDGSREPPHIDGLERIRTTATWGDLALPDDIVRRLREIVGDAQRRSGGASPGERAREKPREPGMAVVFAGAGSVGSLAAEVVASSLGRDLHRVDLSAVVSRYIGETERNLRRLFEAVEELGAVLFFDEADSLFGRRTSVRDSHDRYANQDVDSLLRRIEAAAPLAILASNFREAVDPPWWRHVDAVVRFAPSRG